MTRTTTLTRLERLEILTSRLKNNEPMILREIAEELGISYRSISRDIQILRERGLPVEADRGRGGGVRISPDWGIGRISLTNKEAINLLISIAVTEKMEAPILMANLLSIQRKVVASFSTEDQRKIKRLRERIRIGPSSSPDVISGFNPAEKRITNLLQEAFLMRRKASIRYRSGSQKITERIIEPHYLVLNYPVWYILCWDALRSETRTFRLDRIKSIDLIGETFKLLPYIDFSDSMRGNEVIIP